MSMNNKMLEDSSVNIKIRKVLKFVPFQNESESTPLRRSQPTTGGGGAPKFFLNWLTFALSPYDADHI